MLSAYMSSSTLLYPLYAWFLGLNRAMAEKEDKWREFAFTSIRGGISGMISALICSPLDVIKTRIQARTLKEVGDENKLSHFAKTMRDLYRKEGIRGYFRGITPTLCAVPIFWTSFFPIYSSFKTHYGDLFDLEHEHSALVHVLSAISAGKTRH